MGLRDVEPLLLPPLHGLYEGPLWLGDIGELAHHGAATFRVLTLDHFWLHVEDLEPQDEVGGNAEEGFAYDNER